MNFELKQTIPAADRKQVTHAQYARAAVAGVVTTATAAANAAAVDVTAIVTDIGAQMASITAIAAAVLLIFVGLKAFKWVRRALS